MRKHFTEFSLSLRNNYSTFRATLLLLILTNSIDHFAQTLTAEKIYKKVSDAVVVIHAYDSNNQLSKQGSGVVINDKGYIVTNYHVLAGNERLEVLHNDEIVPYVDIIGIDVEKDILILKIEEKKFPAIKIGNSKSLNIGQRIYAIGSPLGFENTISEGIISGLRSDQETGKNFIQITASISPGSSGGAVVNDKGEVVGISTLTIKEGQNLNFAIPIDEALSVEINSYLKDSAFKYFDWFSKGNIAKEKGNYEEAIQYYSFFIKKNPNNSNAYYNRGLTKLIIEDYKGAIQDFNTAIEINQYFDIAYMSRGTAKYFLGDSKGAIRDFDKSIAINPNQTSVYVARGQINSHLGYYDEAIRDYNKAIENNPLDENAYNSRGISRSAAGDLKGAIQDYTKVIEIDPKSSMAYNNRAIAKLNLGDIDGACDDWSKAGELGADFVYEMIRKHCN